MLSNYKACSYLSLYSSWCVYPPSLMSEAASALSFRFQKQLSMNINEVPVRNNEKSTKRE